MARSKVTITLDRDKATSARQLTGTESTSEVIDVALDHLIKRERLRRDIDAYQRNPQTVEESALAEVRHTDDLTDETDWERLYNPAGD